MPETMLAGAEQWASFYRSGRGNVYPDENLVRLLKGNYADIPRVGRMLDVGFGRGANLVLFAQSGFDAHGLEVSEDSVKAGETLAAQRGVHLTLGLLRGTSLPYPDDYFDLVISWGAVYYHGTRSSVAAAIEGFYRVLRPGGVLLLSVIHPNSFMVRRLSNDLGDGAHEIDRDDPHDNRFGMKIFYDGTSSGWRRLLTSFSQVEEGYAEADLFVPQRRDAWRLFLARTGTVSQ